VGYHSTGEDRHETQKRDASDIRHLDDRGRMFFIV
jgi:hypothetical protein